MSLSGAFNTYASLYLTDARRTAAFQAERGLGLDAFDHDNVRSMTAGWRSQALTEVLVDAGCEVSSKVSDRGFNVNVPRGDLETRSQWAERTEAVAKEILHHSNGEVQIPHETFNGGRIIALTKEGTVADTTFGNVEKGNVSFESAFDPIHELTFD